MIRTFVSGCCLSLAALMVSCIGPADQGIVGLAWIDANSDGIRQDDEMLIPDVPVRLYRQAGGSGDFSVVETQNTDATGSYRFFKTGTMFVEFEPIPGFAFTQKRDDVDETVSSDVDPMTGRSDTFSFSMSDDIFTINDAGYVPVPGGAIRMRLFDDVNGNGIQDPGESQLVDKTVAVRFVDQTRNVTRTVLTSNGVAVASGLPEGKYQVKVVTAGGSLSPMKAGKNGSDPDPISGCTETVVIAGDAIAEFLAGVTDPGEGAFVSGKAYVDENSNEEFDPNEGGLPRYPVLLVKDNNDVVDVTDTDANGFYAFANVPPGSYFIFLPSIPGITVPDDERLCEVVLKKALVGPGMTIPFFIDNPGDHTSVPLPCPSASPSRVTFTGRIWRDFDGNGIRTNDEPPLLGVGVDLVEAETGAVIATDFTNDMGRYFITDVSSGGKTVQLRVRSQSFFARLGQLTMKDVGMDDSVDSDVDPDTGRSDPVCVPTDDAILIEPDAGFRLIQDLTDDTVGVSNVNGIVWDDHNEDGILDLDEFGRDGVTVTLREIATGIERTTVTSNGGLYFFGDVPQTLHEVEVIAPSGTMFSPIPQNVVIQPETSTYVVNDVDPMTGKTDMFTVLPPGPLFTARFVLRSAGLVAIDANLIGDFVWFDINLDGIQNANESGIAGIPVFLLDTFETPIAATRTREGGAYAFEGIAPGDYTVEVFAGGVLGGVPRGFDFTTPNVGGDDTLDSDFTPVSGSSSQGRSPIVTLMGGEQNRTVDAGLLFRFATVEDCTRTFFAQIDTSSMITIVTDGARENVLRLELTFRVACDPLNPPTTTVGEIRNFAPGELPIVAGVFSITLNRSNGSISLNDAQFTDNETINGIWEVDVTSSMGASCTGTGTFTATQTETTCQGG